jgi:hypothetical protein
MSPHLDYQLQLAPSPLDQRLYPWCPDKDSPDRWCRDCLKIDITLKLNRPAARKHYDAPSYRCLRTHLTWGCTFNRIVQEGSFLHRIHRQIRRP